MPRSLPFINPWGSLSSHCKWRVMAVCLCLSCLVGVQAQTVTEQTFKGTPHDEVQKRMSRRDWSGAMATVDEYLKDQPRDPQMRFWRARLLEITQRSDLALLEYQSLAQEYPELPEVQNNLGVLLAAKGQTDEARVAFENALRNNPQYAIAHENLGDIFLHLAQRAYDNAIRLRGQARSLTQKTTALKPALQLTSPDLP